MRSKTAPLQPQLSNAAASVLALYALAAPWQAFAQAADIEHTVRAGDTLMAIATHYTGTPNGWQTLQQHNRIANPRHLRIGSLLRIPVQLLPVGSATVDFVQGQVRVQQGGSSAAQTVQAGTALTEGAQLQVGSDAFVSVRLQDGSLLRIQANSQVQVEQLRKRGRAGDAQSVLELQKGSIDSSIPNNSKGSRRFEIRTPTASTSVRGTRFATTLTPEGRTLSSVIEGSVQVEALRPGAGAGETLRIHAGQGVTVNQDGQLAPAQSLLPAPDLSTLPDTLTDAEFVTVALAPVPGAAAYLVQLAQDSDFRQTLRSGQFEQPLVHLPAVADGQYYIAARALDGAGLRGHISQRSIQVKAHPIAPAYLSPPAQAIVASGLSTPWRCTEVAQAHSYRLQLAADNAFTQPLQDSVTTGQCAGDFAALTPGNYYWRVASLRANGEQGPFGAAQRLQVQTAPATLNSERIALAPHTDGLQLRWPGDAGQSFQLQISPSQDFSQPLIDQALAQPLWPVAGLQPGDYWLRIQTRDHASGLTSDFSALRHIHIPAPIQSGTGLPVTSSDGQALSHR